MAIDYKTKLAELKTNLEKNVRGTEASASSAGSTHESESRFRAMFETIMDGIFRTDLNGRILESNPAFRDMMGYSEAELREITFLDLTPEKWLNWELESIVKEQIFKRGYSEYYEKEFIRKSGEIFPVQSHLWLIRDEGGRPTGMWAIIRDITGRNRAEKSLRDSEQKYRWLFDSIRDGIGLADMNGHMVGFNRALCDMIGYSEDELRRLTYMDLTSPQWHAIEEQIMREQVLPRGYSDLFEKEMVRKSGAKFPVAIRVWLARDDAGYPAGTWALIRDITQEKLAQSRIHLQQEILLAQNKELRTTQRELERSLDELRRASDALQKSENHFRTLFEQMTSGFALHEVITDDQGRPIDYRFLEINSAFEKLTGLRREEVIGRKVTEVIPDLESLWVERYGRVALTGEPIQFEDRSSALGRCYEVKAFSPEPRLFAVIFSDVTEHVRAEEARRLSEERFRQLFTSTTSSVSLNEIVHDEHGKPIDAIFLEVNPGFEELAGLKRDDIIGKRESAIFPFFDMEWIEVCGRVAESGRSEQMEQYFQSLDRHFQLTIYSPARGQFAVIRKDITQERKIQEDLVESRRELEQRMADLRRANEELQLFAYIASHDLQEPLRMIASYLQLLERRYRDRLDQDAGEFIDFAVDGAKRLQKMIESLLEYSRVETRGEPLQPVSLNGIWKEAQKNMEVAMKECDCVISNGQLPTVMGDSAQLIRLFQNLLANSLKFRRGDQPRIEVTASRQNGEWLISFSDNGIGIDPKYSDRVFVIFQRLHGYDFPGAGMGLSISKRIVERHGGRIWVDSRPNEGSTFYFTLPALPDVDTPEM